MAAAGCCCCCGGGGDDGTVPKISLEILFRGLS